MSKKSQKRSQPVCFCEHSMPKAPEVEEEQGVVVTDRFLNAEERQA